MTGRAAAALILLATAVAVPGCSAPSCAGPDLEVAHVVVGGSAWLAAHPGATLRACVPGSCQDVGRRRPAHVYPRGSRAGRTVTVTLTGRRAGHVVLRARERATLREHHLVTGPCGADYEDYATVDVTASGQVDTR